MTGEEKRKKLKEEMKAAYKRDLQKKKEFLEQTKRLRHSKKMNDAISDLTSDLLNDDTDDWINKLNQDAALSEAKLDIHLDEASSTSQKLEKLAKEAEAEKFSAAQLLKDMKREMGLLEDEDEKAKSDASEEETSEEEKKDPPSKSLGDW
ncbi:MAG: hypothetical protein AAF587_09520 [Bacteroidota bacterium]